MPFTPEWDRAYQMLHRSASVRSGQRVLIHGAAGGVGTALLQLGRLADLEMYGTCSSRSAPAVADLGGIPIDYQHQDFVKETHRLTSDGVDVVFDPIGGTHLCIPARPSVLAGGWWAMAFGPVSAGRGWPPGVQVVSAFAAPPFFGLCIAGGWLLPGRKRVVPCSIQTLKTAETRVLSTELDRPA